MGCLCTNWFVHRLADTNKPNIHLPIKTVLNTVFVIDGLSLQINLNTNPTKSDKDGHGALQDDFQPLLTIITD